VSGFFSTDLVGQRSLGVKWLEILTRSVSEEIAARFFLAYAAGYEGRESGAVQLRRTHDDKFGDGFENLLSWSGW
jgi:hypothetical protein